MDSFVTAEKVLQQKLKNACNSKGKETNRQELAVILNKLGLLYRNKEPG